MTSLLMLTIDRSDTTSSVLSRNLAVAQRTDYELLVADNGSKDKKIIGYVASLNPSYHRLNSKNEGCARAFNQLFLRAEGNFICLMGNDIVLPGGWLDTFVKYYEEAKARGIKPGLIGFKCATTLPPFTAMKGLKAHWLDPINDKVFGVTFFHREVLETIGGFCEDFFPYGLEDSDFNNRVNLAGFKSFYIPGMESIHVGGDVGEDSEYRKMKDKSLSDNLPILSKRISEYKTKGVFEKLPPMRAPL